MKARAIELHRLIEDLAHHRAVMNNRSCANEADLSVARRRVERALAITSGRLEALLTTTVPEIQS